MAQPDRFCDIVMKGGITSGIVYPLAICELSEKYSLKNIGGTSAGAVAAAAAAAAEYRRRKGDDTAFKALQDLPGELGKSGRLLRLFQPQAETSKLFAILLASLKAKTGSGKALRMAARAAMQYWFRALLGAAILGGVTWWSVRGASAWAWIPILLLALLGAAIGIAFGIYRSLGKGVIANGYGLCRGFDATRAGSPPENEELTPWLHRIINTYAGRGVEDDPLTFDDLWKAPLPAHGSDLPAASKKRGIDLQMMTTNVTHGRPYLLPFEERLFFDPAELGRYFPEHIVGWLVDNCVPYRPGPSDPPELPGHLLQMPAAKDLPIVVATRLSLSFPGLISAVPLWAVDYEAEKAARKFERCWFSDGGISSNFPVHFFDSLLPKWPTFGVKLERFPKGYTGEPHRIYMPVHNFAGLGESWDRFDEKKGIGRLTEFFFAIVDSAMSWNDNTLAKVPGYRDRIARIRLHEDEGGMNLDMKEEKIRRLSDLGKRAADEIRRRFHDEGKVASAGHAMGWENHRWIRLRSLAAILEETIAGFHGSMKVTAPGYRPLNEQLRDGTSRHRNQYPLSEAQVKTVEDALAALSKLHVVLDHDPLTGRTAPLPLPTLRVRPNL